MEKKFTLEFPSEETFFRSFVELVKPFLGGIRDREADILALLLEGNYRKKAITNKEDRFKLLLSAESRKEIAAKLKITDAVLRNGIMGLRRRNILKSDGTIADVLLIDPDEKDFALIFHLLIKK